MSTQSVLKRHAIRRTWGSRLGHSWSLPPPGARNAADSWEGEGSKPTGSSRRSSTGTRGSSWAPNTVDLLFVLAQPPPEQQHAAEQVLAEEVRQVQQMRRRQAAASEGAAGDQEGWGSRLGDAAAAVGSDGSDGGIGDGGGGGVDIVMVPGLVSRCEGFRQARRLAQHGRDCVTILMESLTRTKLGSVGGLRP